MYISTLELMILLRQEVIVVIDSSLFPLKAQNEEEDLQTRNGNSLCTPVRCIPAEASEHLGCSAETDCIKLLLREKRNLSELYVKHKYACSERKKRLFIAKD